MDGGAEQDAVQGVTKSPSDMTERLHVTHLWNLVIVLNHLAALVLPCNIKFYFTYKPPLISLEQLESRYYTAVTFIIQQLESSWHSSCWS